jgi:glutathione S-transferase
MRYGTKIQREWRKIMELYFAPLACSMSTRITVYEAGGEAVFHCVDTNKKRVLGDGSDFWALNPLGMVPVLRTEEGDLLRENPAVLQYVADHFPAAGLAPSGGPERYKLQQWLNFIGTELHKATYIPLLDEKAPAGAKDYAREKAELRLGYLDSHLDAREFLLDRFTVADAYLVTVLNWSQASGIDLSKWPAVHRYFQCMTKRPSVARALAEERALYAEEMERRKAA